jgi:hypothetical protein
MNGACIDPIAVQTRQGKARRWRLLALLAAGLPLLLSSTGCVTTRKLVVPVPPSIVQSVSPEVLVARLNDQWNKFESLTCNVDILATRLKPKEGVATDYPTFRANVALKKGGKLRVLAHFPVVQTKMFDLASNGTNFTLVIPPYSEAYQGLNASKGTSSKWYENIRPDPLFESMVVRGLDPDDLYTVVTDTIPIQDKTNKRVMLEPEYILTIVRRRPGSQQLQQVRTIHFHRTDLLPYEQDIFDNEGNPETVVFYSNYQDFNGIKYPGAITMKQPVYDYQFSMTVEKVEYNPNPALTDEMFEEKVPDGYKTIELK